jgi:group II intron reverse transcriptase/maturase
MSKLERIIAINKLSKKNKDWIHKDIFRILYKDEIWIAAYENIKNNKGALTATPETMDGMSLERLKSLKDTVCNESYKFKLVKVVHIPSKNGKDRPLGLPTANDKIVQEVIRIILDAIYEPVFHEESFGFRINLGCHDALYHVERKFRWVDYIIEGDIQQAYPKIDHHILVKLIEKRIQDPKFIRLIWKLLGCGAIDQEIITYSKTGVPQGSIVSTIMSNIYFHELDDYVKILKAQLETPMTERKYLKSKNYKALEYKIHKEMRNLTPQSLERKNLSKVLNTLRSERLNTIGLKDKIIRIEYVRYADDWMIGVSNDKALALKIKTLIADFIKNNLNQILHPTKTKVTDIRKGNAHFLGYELFLPRNRPISRYNNGKGVVTIRRGQPELRFDIPVLKITEKYVERGYLMKLENGIRPISKTSYSVLEDHVIIKHYRNVWLGLLNYYSGCTNRGRLQYIHYLLHMSCAMTLGHRHRMSCSAIFAKHGKNLTVKAPSVVGTVSFPYKNRWKLEERRWLLGKKYT